MLADYYAALFVEAFREQLEADEELTPAERAALVTATTPFIYQHTHATFRSMHQRLQQ